jgi:hypothetical protein
MITILLANAAANPPGNTVSTATLWLGVAGATGLFTAVSAFFLSIAAVVLAVRLKGTDKAGKHDVGFVKSLRNDVKEHARRIDERVLAKTATAPDTLESLRSLLRSLRNELSEPRAYLARMANVPVTAFPEPELSSAFGAFAGAVRALGEAVDHFYADTSYAGSDIDIRREKYLLRQYVSEMTNMLELRTKVKETAAKLDKSAGAYITKHGPPVKEEKPL